MHSPAFMAQQAALQLLRTLELQRADRFQAGASGQAADSLAELRELQALRLRHCQDRSSGLAAPRAGTSETAP